jgi:hypothetical protein
MKTPKSAESRALKKILCAALASALFMSFARADYITERAEIISQQLELLQNTKTEIRDAINFRRPGFLPASASFATYPDAVGKICGGTLSVTPAIPRNNAADALLDINNTKQGIKSAIRNAGMTLSDSEPFKNYAKKIMAIGCPGSLGYADENVIIQTTNPDDNESFQCANAKVCEVLANATACYANSAVADFARNAACVGTVPASDWNLMISCNANCGSDSLPHFYPGNIYRIDIRSVVYARNFIFIPTHETWLYSFQQKCNHQPDCPCVGLVHSQNPGDPGYNYEATAKSWTTLGDCGGNPIVSYITVPGTTAQMILDAQPAGSVRVYKLGA